MKKWFLLALTLALACVPASAHMRGYQFAPEYRPDAPKVLAPVIGDYSGIHSVAVLVGLGDLELELRGPTGKRTGTLDIVAWQADDRVEALVRQVLKERFKYVRVPYDHRALAASRAGADFLKTVPAQGVDAFVVVRPNAIGALALQTVAHRNTILWTDFEIVVIDARTLAVIGSATARIQQPGSGHANFPGLVVGREFALDTTLHLDPAKAEKLRLLTGEMLTATVTETLGAMGLGQ